MRYASTLLRLTSTLLMVALVSACHGEGAKDDSTMASTSDDSGDSTDSRLAGMAGDDYEICDDGLDNDGDGLTDDDDVADCRSSRPEDDRQDRDGDGYSGSSAGADDCDDEDARVNPSATELCDGVDNDCDGEIDEVAYRVTEFGFDGLGYTPGCAWFFKDGDGDAYGTITEDDVVTSEDAPRCACEAPDGWVTDSSDCDDGSTYAEDHYPGAEPRCDGWPDDDCDGLDDDEEETAYGACEELADSFCLTGDDASCLEVYTDGDGDGEGDADDPRCLCADELTDSALYGLSESSLDCDDLDPDFTYVVMYPDLDEDGYGDEDKGPEALCEEGPYYAPNNTDCDDGDREVYPSQREDCTTRATDDNCNEDTNDEGALHCSEYPYDGDGDTYGSTLVFLCLCRASGETKTVTEGGDCDDTDDGVNPDASEVSCDDIDNDCDDSTLDQPDVVETECDGEDNDCDASTVDDPDDSCALP